MNLRDRLRALEGDSHDRVSYHETDNNYQGVMEILKGRLIKTTSGMTFLARSTYPLPHYNGYARLSEDNYYPNGILRLLGKRNANIKPSAEDILYLDTETTGLSGGTGTCPFLIGLGYFQEDTFYIDQYFLLDYSEEVALLETINSTLAKYSILCTYNGKTFDLPLVKTRFKLNRVDMEFAFEEHLDLLHAARKFWKRRLDNCSLNQVEQSILGSSRKEDIPGNLIPQVYFDYVTNGDLQYMPIVFEHNRMDILSLACLTGYMSHCADSPLTGPISHGIDFYSMGRFYVIQGDFNNAIACYQRALEYKMSDIERFETLKELALIYKRHQQWDNSIELWTEMLTTYSLEREYVIEEIAKYYEHKIKDYPAALELVEKYLSDSDQKIMLNKVLGGKSMKRKEAMIKRLHRLKTKDSRMKQRANQTAKRRIHETNS